ncbi:ATPase [uncultured Clostridium sp.]|uniref:ATPase n=1 Tax=uncultured Clostridium sp. TaxID=59620 RepID=UPI0025D994FF|nr:ATPase [uncultured Clostridium sp.]
MNNVKERHVFPGGNTTKGFYSFYKYILSQDKAKRIICLKGGPGTGKSSFMKKIGTHFKSLGYALEYHHCSSDNNSLDGIVIKDLNVGVIDSTAPHMIDPITPGAVDEILNLGIALNTEYLEKNKKAILSICSEISENFNRAYKYMESAEGIHKDWTLLNNKAVENIKYIDLEEEMKDKIFKGYKGNYGNERHLFSSAFTPDGIVTFNKDLAKECEKLYVLQGGPGLKKSIILKDIGLEAQKRGYNVEYFHDPFIPERIENIIISEISTGIFTTNEISRVHYSDIQCKYNMNEICFNDILEKNASEIDFDKSYFDILNNKAISCISKSHTLHDELETYYIDAMNFDIVDELYEETLKKLSFYIGH